MVVWYNGSIINIKFLNMSNNNEVTTGEIMEFLKENMVTKEDIREFVTKQELTQEFRKFQQEILDGVDEKLFNLRGDLVMITRGEDRKVAGLIGLLHSKNIISEKEAQALLMMEPFPRLFAQQ